MRALDFDTLQLPPAAHAGSATAADIETDWLDLGSEFVDARIIARRWQAARTGPKVGPDGLPAYEELALGNLGRFADEMAVVRCTSGHEPVILRAGSRFETVVGSTCASTPISGLFHAFSFAIGAALDGARIKRNPHLALSKALVDGMVSTVETVAFPLSCRWPGEYFLLFIRPRASRLDLAHMLINSAQQGIMALSPVEHSGKGLDFYVLGINLGAAGYFGAHPAELQHTLLSSALARVGLTEALPLFAKAQGAAQKTSFELEYQLGGEPMALQAGVAATEGILAVTLTDVRDIKARAALFHSLFDENPVPMYLSSADGRRFLNVNAAALNLYGYDREAFFALGFDRICDQPAGDGSAQEATSVHRTSSGATLDVIEYAKHVNVEGQPAILSTIVDITDRKRAEAHVTYLAHHDPLTGMFNRTVFTREIERLAAKAGEPGSGFAVLLVDLDDFKIVNDTHGHAAGDCLLVEMSRRLQALLRKSDILARLGGDEFAILVPGIASRAEVEDLAGRLLSEITGALRFEDTTITARASIGAAIAPLDGADMESLLKSADLALYRAKHSGKGTVQLFERSMDRRARERRALEVELRNADIGKEFEIHYQPIMSVRTGQLRGFEALLRWRHPTRGTVSPADFIPLAEETGVIDVLGRWVLAEACRMAASWPEPLVVAVNVSPVQFRRGQLVEAVSEALAGAGLDAGRLEVEITESVLLEETEGNIVILRRLREAGVRIALDDFGTGYSSMNYLRKFPFSRLKIDRSFIRDISESPESLAIVRAIIGLGASLGIDTTAEGVETALQLEMLRSEHCGELQGYLFSPPVPGDDARAIIDAYFGKSAAVA
jgi:diguanylate cyclase (GGDEF)-like protein